MAPLAVVTELAAVHVIPAVTTDAACIQGDPGVGGPPMAGRALESHMSAVQPEPGLQVVIKLPQRPVDRVVTIATGRAERQLVHVVVAMTIDALVRRVPELRVLVAARALGISMRPDQRETRQAVIESDGLLPIRLAVTITARLSELAGVRIISLVTAITISGRTGLVHRYCVAAGAFEIGMCAEQSEPGFLPVLETDGRPRARGVAVAALLAVDPVMLVVVAMTIEARSAEADLEDRLGVTIDAADLGMFSGQLEIGLQRVHEAMIGPAARIVTGLAFDAIPAFVRVVGCVAPIAGRGRVLIDIVDVTADALDPHVSARQRETGLGHVIEQGFGPLGRLMAGLAFTPEAAVMRIVTLVTVVACRRCLAESLAGFVTIAAVGLEVDALQLEVRQCVIEGFLVEADDVGIAALVIRVAGRAVAVTRLGIAAVITDEAIDIGGNVFMAIQALTALLRTIEGNVTRTAFGLDLGVRGHDLTRHDQGLEFHGVRACDPVSHDQDSCRRKASCRHRRCRQYMWTARTCTSTDTTIMQKNGT